MNRVSLVTISFNQKELLETCLHSVLDQQIMDLEYIVVDPGNTDEGFVMWAVQPGFTDPDSGRSLQVDGIFFRE